MKFIPYIIGIIAFITLFVGGFFLFENYLFNKNGMIGVLDSGSMLICDENSDVGEISSGFVSKDTKPTVKFKTIFEVPRKGPGRGSLGINSSIWVTDNGLAYIVGYFKEDNTSEKILYYNNKEEARFLSGFVFPLEEVTSRLAYYVSHGHEKKFIFGDESFSYTLSSVNEAREVNGKLFIRGSGGTYFNEEKISDDVRLFSVNGSRVDIVKTFEGKLPVKTEEHGTLYFPHESFMFTYKNKEYGKEFGGFTGEIDNITFCNDTPIYIVQEESKFDRKHAEYLIRDGEVIAGPYFKIPKVDIIGGKVVYIAEKEPKNSNQERSNFVLVSGGEEVSKKYTSASVFFDHNGYLLYTALNRQETPQEKYYGEIKVTSTAIETEQFLVEDGIEIFRVPQDEQIRSSSEIVLVDDKIAILLRQKDTKFSRVLYDGTEVLREYNGEVTKLFNLNNKLGASIVTPEKTLIVIEK